MSVRCVSVARVSILIAVAGLLAGCVTSGTPTAGVSSGSTAALPVVAPRHQLSSECASHVSAAECRRIHAEGIRLMLASCPQNDASCSRVRVVSARRVNAGTAEITVRDADGKRSVRRVPVAMSTATAAQ